MSEKKKRVRKTFRDDVFRRDGFRCAVCSRSDAPLDAHHIIDRNEIANGGYVKENGISLCPCHLFAEVYHQTGEPMPGYAPADLFRIIGSDPERANKAARRLRD